MTGLEPDKSISGVSVVICCHNSEKRLPATLRHLAAQVAPAEMAWEVIVVDNASTDRTREVAVSSWPQGFRVPLRIVAEPSPGLNQARLQGIREARFNIVSLVDDDNWVASDWVCRVAALFAEHPEVGACGGRSVAAPEAPTPDWFDKVCGFYAVGQQNVVNGDITHTQGTLLWGAGLSLRVTAFRALLAQGFHFFVQDRRGTQLSSGGDTEICFALRALGWRLWYDDALVLQHFIPKERLQWSYTLRLMRGMGQSSVLFLIYHVALRLPPFDAYPRWKRTWAFQFLKASRETAGCCMTHPWQCAFQPEGADAAIWFNVFRGRLAMLLSIRTDYRHLTSAIETAKWATRPT